MVVLDGSGSIGGCEFEKGKKALKYMMKMAMENPDVDTKYAAVSYSDDAVVDFDFLPYSEAANDITGIRYVGGVPTLRMDLRRQKDCSRTPRQVYILEFSY